MGVTNQKRLGTTALKYYMNGPLPDDHNRRTSNQVIWRICSTHLGPFVDVLAWFCSTLKVRVRNIFCPTILQLFGRDIFAFYFLAFLVFFSFYFYFFSHHNVHFHFCHISMSTFPLRLHFIIKKVSTIFFVFEDDSRLDIRRRRGNFSSWLLWQNGVREKRVN